MEFSRRADIVSPIPAGASVSETQVLYEEGSERWNEEDVFTDGRERTETFMK